MKTRRKAECKPRLVQAAPGVDRVSLNRYSERGQNVGAATAARHRTVPVLDDWHASAGNHQGHGGADIEGAEAVSTGPTGVEDAGSLGVPADHMLAQHARRGGDLCRGLALHA